MHTKKFNALILALGTLIAAIGFALPALLVLLLELSEQSISIGIIGGADGPSYWFLLWNSCYHIPAFLISFGVTVLITGLYGLLLGKSIARYSSPTLTLFSGGISIVLAGGAVCFLEFIIVSAFSNKIYQYPIAGPVSALGCLLAFLGFVVLLALYCKFRKEKMSIKGILLDILLVVLTFLPLFFTVCYLGEFAGYLI